MDFKSNDPLDQAYEALKQEFIRREQKLKQLQSSLYTGKPVQSQIYDSLSTRKLVLIDIDDTVAITSPMWIALTERFMADRGHKRIRPPEQDTYRIEDSFDFPEYLKPAYFQYMYQNMPWSSLPVNPAAVYFVDRLDNTHTVEFVTSRPHSIVDVTIKWIEKHFGKRVIHFEDIPVEIADYLVDNSQRRIALYKAYNPNVRALLYTEIFTERFPQVNDFKGFTNLVDVYKYIKEDK